MQRRSLLILLLLLLSLLLLGLSFLLFFKELHFCLEHLGCISELCLILEHTSSLVVNVFDVLTFIVISAFRVLAVDSLFNLILDHFILKLLCP